ncbi:TPA: BCCT family transporter [Pseudomonas aeruginosa]|nr:BCCT family transporter [Pseudomonas aeruginosa]
METPTTPRSTLNPPVFYTSAALILALVLFTVLLQEEAQSLFNHVQQWIITNASWFYVLAVALILISVVFLAVSRYGDIKLGPDHSRPDYRNTTWFAMLFSAGMGIGLMFFGVAEPVMHFTTPPVGEPNTVQAAKEAMKLTFFHWGLHAWAIYAIVALILAFFSYRHGLPLTLLWMTVFGDTAIHMVLQEGFTQLAEVVNQDSSVALFAFLEHFPLGSVISLVAVLMVVVFFVTSADSGALVVDMLASSGKDHSPLWQRIFWSVLMGVVAIALLLADGLKALQTATIASALPFSIVLLASIWGLFKALHLDATKRGIRYQALTFSRPTTRSGASEGDGWQRRLRNIAMFPRRSHVNRFITDVARPACEDVAAELRKQGYEVQVQDGEDGRVRLEVSHGGEVDFIYEVRPRAFTTPSFVMRDTEDSSESRKYFRAEVHLQEGGQDYDIMGWSRDGVIGDILDQYERHMHFLHVVR